MTQLLQRTLMTGLAAAGTIAPAAASTVELMITLPQLKVAEYHRPYVAIWLEEPGQTSVRTLAVWYDYDNRENGGIKWLRDLRTWWRKGGRDLTKPADGVTGATRPAGPQRAKFDLGNLKPGNYVLTVEAAREEGGREVVNLAFTWNGRAATATGKGSTELGAITANIKP